MKIKKNLDIVLYEKIKESFMKGDYELGQKIDIDELAEKYEVSRTPIIQAIKCLENEGMMETGRGGKIMIPQYTPTKIRQIYDMRLLLEKYAMQHICMSANSLDLSRLERYANECRMGYDVNDIVTASKADLKFHREIVKCAENECLNSLYNKVQGQCLVVNYLLKNSASKYHQERCCLEHQGIIDSLKSKEFEQSGMMLEKHLKRNVDRLLMELPAYVPLEN